MPARGAKIKKEFRNNVCNLSNKLVNWYQQQNREEKTMFTDTTNFEQFEALELPFDEAWGEFESPEQEADYWSDFSVLEDISQDW